NENICKKRYGEYAICNLKADSFGKPLYSFDCDKDYYYDPSSKKCVEIKENYCKMGDTSCQQICTIENEKQKCGCFKEFRLNTDNKTCV
ncbi:matrilin-3-like, partial [Centruroides sculpturatus]|uniref:matrilin-3-like n=1 Tax=Centruroides sculpturatus TaxID=218467 RepID=UPI000C6E9EC6